MSKDISALNFMYCMENFATQVYRWQTGAFKGIDIGSKLQSAMENEHQHAQNLQKRIKEKKGRHSRLAFLFQMAGGILGLFSRIAGKTNLLKMDAWVETRAIQDYGKYLRRVSFDTDTMDLLQRIIEDEERHVTIWTASAAQLKSRAHTFSGSL